MHWFVTSKGHALSLLLVVIMAGVIAFLTRGHWLVFINPLPLLFILFYLASSTVLTRGSNVLYQLLRGLIFVVKSPTAQQQITHRQLPAEYRRLAIQGLAAGIIAFVIGALSIHFYANNSVSPANYRYAYGVNLVSLWHAILLAQWVFMRANKRLSPHYSA